MIELVELRSKILESGALSLDLETTSKKPREAKITLVALAAGHGADIYSVALPPTDEVLKFVKEWVYDPTVRLVGHNLVTYDLLVLHLNGVIDFNSLRAKIVDTLPMAWLYNEKIDHGLKFLVWKFFDQKMVTYEEAFLTSPKIQMIKSVSLGIESQKDLLERLDEDNTKAKKKENATYTRALKEKFKDFQGSRAEKVKAKELCIRKIGRRLGIQYGEAALERKRREMERSIILLGEQKKVYEIEAEMDQRAYAADDAKQTMRLFRRLRRELEVKDLLRWADIEVKSRIVAGHMMISGAPIDVERLQKQDEIFIPLIREFEADVTDAAKMSFNPGSNKEIAHILYDILGLTDVTGERKTEEKNLSRLDHPISQAILNYRTVKKLHSTYVKKLFAIAKENDGRVYGTVNPHGSETGRASASDPNLQNIPSKKKPAEYDERIQNLGPRIRWVFKPKPGRKLICADLSQIELRITTTVTGDKNLLDVYSQNTVYNGLTYWTGDIHDKTAKALNVSRKIAKNLNFGLCLRKGTKVLTKRGYISIEYVRVGDLILTHKNRWRTVTALQRPVAQELVRIQTSTGKVVEATPDHMYQRYFPKANGSRGGTGWVCCEDLRSGDYLCYHGHGYSDGLPADKDACRLLGWFLSEGSYQNSRIKIAQSPVKNPDVAEKMTKTLGRLGFEWYDLDGSSPHLSSPVGVWRPMLSPFGIDMTKKSGDKTLPDTVFDLDDAARLEILGSLWDGDGCVSVTRRRGQITYTSKSKKLLDGVVRLLDSVGINAKVYYYPSQNRGGVNVIGSRSKIRFLDIVPTVKVSHHRYSPKKQFDAEEKIVRTTRVRLSKPEVVYDLTVEDDHSFVANGLVTHNCYGMGPDKFAVYAKLYKPGTKTYDIEKAREFKNQFMSFYQGVPDTLDLIDGLINGRDGYPRKNFRMLSGRCRHFQDNEEFFFGTAFNAIIQGSAADVLKVILWKLYEGIILNPEFAGTKLVWQVHDEVGIEVDEALAEKVGIITKYIMERSWFPLPVPVLASVKICEDWSGKDDDYVPEVGLFYARLSDKGTVTDRIFTSDNWKEFADFEEAAKKDEKAKKPENESKIVMIKPCVAMLTPEQEAMAARYCPAVESYSDPNGYNHTENEA